MLKMLEYIFSFLDFKLVERGDDFIHPFYLFIFLLSDKYFIYTNVLNCFELTILLRLV